MARKKIAKNYVYLILDESESMRTVRDAVIKATNEIMDTVRRRAAVKGQETFVSLQKFNTVVERPLYVNAPVEALQELTLSDYCPHDMTALFDCIGDAALRMEAIDYGPNDSVVFFIITDGDNNKFYRFTEQNIKALIAKHEENFTFGFQVPPGRRDTLVRRFGIPEGNVSEWEATQIGTQRMSEGTQAAVGQFFDDRKAGKRTSKSLFKVKVDAPKPAAIKRQLSDLASEFRSYVVARESAIREFVEDQTGNTYVPGTAYYQLVKPETVQPSKQVVLQEKPPVGSRKRPAIYGGPDARDLIGLPVGQYAKVTPGDHGNYDVFIQSKSLNRILPRGSRVLVKVS